MSDFLPVKRSQAEWQFEFGPIRWRIAYARETRAALSPVAPTPPSGTRRRSAWPVAAGAFASVSAFGLLVFGAHAMQPQTLRSRYLVSVAVPAAVARSTPVPARFAAGSGDRSPYGHRAPTVSAVTARRDDDERFVAAAMKTGEVQEWVGADGQRRFLTAGPASLLEGRHCRDIALLTHLVNGGSHVRSFERCTAATVDDAPPKPEAADEGNDSPA